MSGAVRCLSRLALQFNRQTTAKRKAQYRERPTPVGQFRRFSSAPFWLDEENNASKTLSSETGSDKASKPQIQYLTIEDLEDSARAEFDRASPDVQQEWREGLRALSEVDHTAPFADELNAMEEDITRETDQIEREEPIVFTEVKPNKLNAGFWADEEDDEFGRVFDDNNEFRGDDITTPAHAQLDLHRDMREYQRRIAWDMPLLKKFSQRFTPPPLTSPLRFRYTTYMGEHHPSARKIVVEFCPSDLPNLTPQQRNKLIKLAGVRYNPSTTVIKISCEKFETQAQNKRYLGDLVNKLVNEATDPEADSFEDVPFDFRHHKAKVVHEFPEGWRLGSGEKVRGLVEGRQRREKAKSLLSQEGRGKVVDGEEIVRQYVEAVAAFQARGPTAPMTPVRARGPRQIAR